MKKLYIVIVNWNSSNYLKTCLESIYRYVLAHDIGVIVLDNASYDGSEEIVKSYPQNFQFIQLEENVGFARANNIGFNKTHSKYCLFLNPDTVVKQDIFEKFFEIADCDSSIGALGCQLLNEDKTLQTSSIQPFPTIINQIVNSNFFVNRSSCFKMQRSALKTPVDVDMISGACLFVVSEVFSKVGMFSTDYFMYGEDLDLCYKIKKEGYRILFTNTARVTHLGGKSSRKRSTYYGSVLMRDSIYHFLKKFQGPAYAAGYRIGIAVSAFFRCLVLFPVLTVKWRAFKYIFEKWFRMLRWALGLETWVKHLSHDKKSD